jgi:hypothetical protein
MDERVRRKSKCAAATADFKQAMANLGSVGFSFVGGCFYGLGVRVSGGGARFAVTNYAVKRARDYRRSRVADPPADPKIQWDTCASWFDSASCILTALSLEESAY